MTKEKLITVVGPTAAGKTKLAIYLAKKLHSVIISGDAFQVYRGLDIGTAKVTVEEADGVPHYLINCLEPTEPYSAAVFQEKAKKYISEENKKGLIPIVAGGTGLYIQGLLEGYDYAPKLKKKKEIRQLYETEGTIGLRKALKEMIPEEEIPADPHRMMRLLELKKEGLTISSIKSNEQIYDGPVIGITMDRTSLYDRINKRVHVMIEQGLKTEVERILASGVPETAQALKGIGYKEMIPVIHGTCSLEEAEMLIAKNTRHFAKRQLTWYKRMPYIHWISGDTKTWLEEAESYVNSWYRGEETWMGK